ncbi:MAG: hypothetical protein IJW64_03780 [Clostridia bacterium]|nr:hypothetical protein [Clostridia bacterium]
METKLNVCDCELPAIKNMSEELIKLGVDGAEFYYVDDESSFPFFKIEKPYKKEKDGDPDAHALFIDVDIKETEVEYTVVGLLCHEHFSSAQLVAELMKGLICETVAEVALVYPNMKASFFVVNRDDPAKNVSIIDKNAKIITERLFGSAKFSGCHIHSLFVSSCTNYLLCDYKDQLKIKDVKIYLVSAVAGYHPEYYVIQ